MSEFFLGLLAGVAISGVIRVSVGRFIVYTGERGFVWQWSRYDDEDQRIIDRVNSAMEIGAHSERLRAARSKDE